MLLTRDRRVLRRSLTVRENDDEVAGRGRRQVSVSVGCRTGRLQGAP